MGQVTLASDAKFLKGGGTCTSAPNFCWKCGCHGSSMTLYVYVPTWETHWEELVEKYTRIWHRWEGGKWVLTTQASPYSNFQVVCWISPTTLGRFFIFWIFGSLLCALDVKRMHILKWYYFNLDGNKEEMMDPAVIIICFFHETNSF